MNYDAFRWINDLSGNAVADAVMRFAAQELIYVVFITFGILCLARLRHRQVLAVLQGSFALVAAFVFGAIAAALYREQRPFSAHPRVHELITHAPGQSFPSDHAAAAFAVALAVLVFMSRSWGWLLLVVASLIAFARVYVGVHYPGDVVGALVIALLGVVVALAATPLLRRLASRVGIT